MKHDVLIKLVNAFGVSGKEMEVRELIEKEIKKHVTNLSTDKMGNHLFS